MTTTGSFYQIPMPCSINWLRTEIPLSCSKDRNQHPQCHDRRVSRHQPDAMGKFQTAPARRLSQGADSLIVGDVKQSIYRWRNGDWGILNGLNDRIEHFPIKVKTLATNRRSETNVIRFNNQIFTAAVNYLNDVFGLLRNSRNHYR